ncbi:MAG: hypothetical protein WAK17_09420 [Candidatus Nitrosopolaris sp.]
MRKQIDVPILMISILITSLFLALLSQTNIIDSRAFAQLTIPNEPSSNNSRISTSTGVSNNGATMTIHTTNLIQG